MCTVANGKQCKVAGIFSSLTRLRDRVRVIDFMVLAELHDLILGMDFLMKIVIVPDSYSNVGPSKKKNPIY